MGKWRLLALRSAKVFVRASDHDSDHNHNQGYDCKRGADELCEDLTERHEEVRHSGFLSGWVSTIRHVPCAGKKSIGSVLGSLEALELSSGLAVLVVPRRTAFAWVVDSEVLTTDDAVLNSDVVGAVLEIVLCAEQFSVGFGCVQH